MPRVHALDPALEGHLQTTLIVGDSLGVEASEVLGDKPRCAAVPGSPLRSVPKQLAEFAQQNERSIALVIVWSGANDGSDVAVNCRRRAPEIARAVEGRFPRARLIWLRPGWTDDAHGPGPSREAARHLVAERGQVVYDVDGGGPATPMEFEKEGDDAASGAAVRSSSRKRKLRSDEGRPRKAHLHYLTPVDRGDELRDAMVAILGHALQLHNDGDGSSQKGV